MFQNIIGFVASRCFFIGASKNVSFLTAACVLGIAFSVAILICILSIMNGFEEEVKSRSFGADGHISLEVPVIKSFEEESIIKELSADKDLVHLFQFTEEEAIVSVEDTHTLVMIRGLVSSDQNLIEKLNSFSRFNRFDELENKSFKAILGRELLDKLGLEVGDSIKLFSPKIQFTPMGYFFRSRSFEIVDEVQFRYKLLDSSIVFLSLGDSDSFFGPKNSNKIMRLHYKEDIDISKKIKSLTSNNMVVKTWKDENLALYQALVLEKFVMFITLLLAIIIAVLNVTSVLIIGIISQRSTVGILYILGLEKERIQRIFTTYGLLVGSLGLVLGVVFGILLSIWITQIVSFVESLFGFSIFPADLYYISEVPSILEIGDITLVLLSSMIMLLISIIVSSTLSKNVEINNVSRNQ